MNKDSIVYTVIFTFIATFIFVLILAFVNYLTRDIVQRNNEILEKRSILKAMGFEVSSDEMIIPTYNENISTIEPDDGGDFVYDTLYRRRVDGETVYAKKFYGSGLWGTIRGVLAVNDDVTQIHGIEFISHNETPGLGGRIDEPVFKKQFENESVPQRKISVTKGTGEYGDDDKTNSRVDAITGATRTSESIEVIVNKELPVMKDLLEAANE